MVLAALLVIIGTCTAAAQQVVVMLRNGERVGGRFDGIDNGQVHVVTGHGVREVPYDQVALFDLLGDATGVPESELSQARGSQHLAVMKDGSTVKGTTVRIEAGHQEVSLDRVIVVFRTENGEERRIPMHDMRRLYLGNYPGAAPSTSTPTTSSTPSPAERVISVPATRQWTDTGITVRQGQPLTITATGEITLSADPNDKAGPSGALSGRNAPRAPLPQTPAGALIGRIGNGRPFGIGAGPANIEAPGTGRLYLGINDDGMNDNTGQYEVRISGAGGTASLQQSGGNNSYGIAGRRRRP